MKKKLFISHASEDKDDLVRPLAEKLSSIYDVWYDEYKLVIGMSLLEEINKGLANCDYGIVVFSSNFFAKKWPQGELNGLFALEEENRKVILPIWKDITESDVKKNLPMLVDRRAVKAEKGIDGVVEEINRAISYFDYGKHIQSCSNGLGLLKDSLEKREEIIRSETIIGSSQGVKIALDTARDTMKLIVEQFSNVIAEKQYKAIKVLGPDGNKEYIFLDIQIGEILLKLQYVNKVINSAKDARISVQIIRADLDTWGKVLKGSNLMGPTPYSLFINNGDNRLWKDPSGQFLTPQDLADSWFSRLSTVIP